MEFIMCLFNIEGIESILKIIYWSFVTVGIISIIYLYWRYAF